MDFTGPAWIHGWALRGGRFSSPAPRPSILGNISEIFQKYFLDILPIFPQRGRATEARPLGAKTGPFQLEKYLLDICSTFVKYSFPISCLFIFLQLDPWVPQAFSFSDKPPPFSQQTLFFVDALS